MQQRNPMWTVLSLVLAFLPECVYFRNKVTTQRFSQTHQSTTNVQHTSLPINAKVTLNIPTMGCVACVNKVDSSIRGCSLSKNIQQEKSWLKDGKGGVAEISVSSETAEGVEKVVQEVKRAVEHAGFQCEVGSIQMNAS